MPRRQVRKSGAGGTGVVPELERLRAENAALRGQIDQFRRFADETAHLIYIRDLETGRVVFANNRFGELLGYTPAEVMDPGFDPLVLTAPDSREKVRRSREMHERGEEHLPFEFTMRARDGRRIDVMLNSWLISYGGHRAVVGVVTDMSAEHGLADRLRGALDRTDSIIAALGEGIVVQDRRYRVTYQNAVNRRLFGERVGELCFRAFEGRDDICPGCPVERTLADGQVHRHVTTVAVDGHPRHFELVSSPLRDAAGRVVAGLKLVRDISAQVEAAEALRQAKEELERQNVELRALDRLKDGLLRDVSHELKTPVAKQAMQLEILRMQLGGACADAVGKTVAVLEEGVRRQQRVINNLLDLARLESGRRIFHLGAVRVDAVLARVIEDHRPALDAAGFAVAVRCEPVTATADEEMLWHVLSNLVNNAVKFAAREGPRRLEAGVAAAGGRAVVRIADNGAGLTPEEQQRAFDRFYQASAAIEGSGVGLSICRSIMEGMGGSVTLESPGRGRGAVASVALPL